MRLTPKGGRAAIEGFVPDAEGRLILKARVAEPPEKGRANQALCRLLAKQLGVPPSAVSVDAGETSRTKTVRVTGEPQALLRVLEGWATSGRP